VAKNSTADRSDGVSFPLGEVRSPADSAAYSLAWASRLVTVSLSGKWKEGFLIARNPA
jgi:hypothetical protein